MNWYTLLAYSLLAYSESPDSVWCSEHCITDIFRLVFICQTPVVCLCGPSHSWIPSTPLRESPLKRKGQEFLWKGKPFGPQGETRHFHWQHISLCWVWRLIFKVYIYFHSHFLGSLWRMAGIVRIEGCYAAEVVNCLINFSIINLYYAFREVTADEKPGSTFCWTCKTAYFLHSTHFNQHWINSLYIYI